MRYSSIVVVLPTSTVARRERLVATKHQSPGREPRERPADVLPLVRIPRFWARRARKLISGCLRIDYRLRSYCDTAYACYYHHVKPEQTFLAPTSKHSSYALVVCVTDVETCQSCPYAHLMMPEAGPPQNLVIHMCHSMDSFMKSKIERGHIPEQTPVSHARRGAP